MLGYTQHMHNLKQHPKHPPKLTIKRLLFLILIPTLAVFSGVVFFVTRNLTFDLGPSLPTHSKFAAEGIKEIATRDTAATDKLNRLIQEFEQANPSLVFKEKNIVDGCGLFSEGQSGYFTTGVRKECAVNIQSYYTSRESSQTVVDQLRKTIEPTMVVSAYNAFNPPSPCGSFVVGSNSTTYSSLKRIGVASATANSEGYSCDSILKLMSPAQTIDAYGMLGGYDAGYIDVRSQSFVNNNTLNASIESDTPTAAVVLWSMRYY